MFSSTPEAAGATRPPWVLVSEGFHCLGGQSKANLALAEYLVGEGYPVHLVGHDFHSGLHGQTGVTVHTVRRPINGWNMSGWMTLSYFGRRIARRVLHQDPRARVVVNGACCRWHDINWVHCVHHAWAVVDRGAPLWFRMKNRLAKRLARANERRSIGLARLIVANSRRTQRDLIEHLGVPADRTRVVHLGAEADWLPATPEERRAERRRLGVPESAPVVLFVGALSYDCNKGFDTLMAAWERLSQHREWDPVLVVLGAGSGLEHWRRHTERARLSQRVHFLGFSDRVYNVLGAADLLVSPVRYEAFGLNVQEALCRGVPAMVSAQAGVAEIYSPEVTGLILPDPGDAEDLAARLGLWRKHIAVWQARFTRFAEQVRKHTWMMMAREIVTLAEQDAGPGAGGSMSCAGACDEDCE